MKTYVILLSSALALAGCANPYTQFYRGSSHPIPPRVDSGDPQIVEAPDFASARAMQQQYEANGYATVGVSSFDCTGSLPTSLVLQQARKVGASLIVRLDEFSHTEQGVAAVPLYQPGQTYVSHVQGGVMALAPGGLISGNYNGDVVTETPGTFSTAVVPYTRQIYHHEAGFLRKVKEVSVAQEGASQAQSDRRAETVAALNYWENQVRMRDPDFGLLTDPKDPTHGNSTADRVFDALNAKLMVDPDMDSAQAVAAAQRAYDLARSTK